MTTKFGRRRASFVGLDLEQLPGDRSRATVKLVFQGQQYVGRADGGGLDQEVWCAAEAAGDALRHLVGTERSAFEVLDLQSITVLEVPGVIVALSVRWQDESKTLAGFSLAREDDRPHAAVRGVLSSTNRFLEWLWYTQEASPAAASELVTRGPERRSGVGRRTVVVMPAVLGKPARRSGEERRSWKDRRRYNLADLDECWDQLVEAVRAEFWRWPQDPDAVFEPRRDELKLQARVDRPGQDAEWLAVTLTSGQVLNGDLATYATEFVALYRREREGPTNST